MQVKSSRIDRPQRVAKPPLQEIHLEGGGGLSPLQEIQLWLQPSLSVAYE